MAFWSALLTAEPLPSPSREFASLRRPSGMPLGLLLQRLGTTDRAQRARGHLDLACGDGVEALVAVHRALGASVIGPGRLRTVMADPAGRTYCLTRRDPDTGRLPAHLVGS